MTIKEIIEKHSKIEIIPKLVREKEYVTREMAIDAGDLQLEGTLYSDEQCEYNPEIIIDYDIIVREICEEIEKLFRDTPLLPNQHRIFIGHWRQFKEANGIKD